VSEWCVKEYSTFKEAMARGSRKKVFPILLTTMDASDLDEGQKRLFEEIQSMRQSTGTDFSITTRESEHLKLVFAKLADEITEQLRLARAP
jgi:transcriptional accessory protein Tex/SPT6